MASTIEKAAPAVTGGGAGDIRQAERADGLSPTVDRTPFAIPDLPACLDRKRIVRTATPAFDYGRLEPSIASMLRKQAAFIRNRIANTSSIIVETGAALLAAKERLDHGQFTAWVEAEINIGIRTAQNYMRAAIWAKGKN